MTLQTIWLADEMVGCMASNMASDKASDLAGDVVEDGGSTIK